MFRRQL